MPRPVDSVLVADGIEYLDALFDDFYANAVTPDDGDVVVRQVKSLLQSWY